MKRLLPILLLLLAPTAMAQINSPEPFDLDVPFSAGIGPESGLSLASGAVEATILSEHGTYGFFDAVGLRINGIDRACWGNGECVAGDIGILVGDGSSAAVRFPTPTNGGLTADHAVSFFVDWQDNEELQTLDLGQAMVANTVEGEFSFGAIPEFHPVGVPGPDDSGVLVLVGGNGTVTVTRDGEAYAALGPDEEVRVLFEGTPVVAPFRFGLGVVPFEAGSRGTYTAAAAQDAQEGLDLSTLTQALSGGPGNTSAQDAPEVPEAVAGILSAAAVHLPPNATDLETLIDEGTLLRFEELEVTNSGAGGLDWQGEAALQVSGGEVAGADPLILLWPWWAYLLWAIAIGAFVARIVLKADKHHETWDKYRLIGLIGGLVAGIIVFLLWDFETRSVWGVSLLHGAGEGASLGIVALVQLVPLSLVGLGIGLPLQSILKSAPMLARQGTFMGLGKVVAPFLMYLLGAPLLIDYLGFLLDKAGSALGG